MARYERVAVLAACSEAQLRCEDQLAAARIVAISPEIQISIAGGGSGAGIKQVGEGLVDIGNSGRKANKDEIARFGLKIFKWAVKGICPSIFTCFPHLYRRHPDKRIELDRNMIAGWRITG